MKVKKAQVKVKAIAIKGSVHDEKHGWRAKARVSLEIVLEDVSQIHDCDLREAVGKMLELSRIKGKKSGANTSELKSKREFGAVEHKFLDPVTGVLVDLVGEVPHVKFRTVEGVLQLVYGVDCLLPLAGLATLVSFMDAPVELTTTSSQLSLLDESAAA